MASDYVPSKAAARVWSQYEQVKNHIANLHIGFVESVVKLQAAHISGQKESSTAKEYRISAFQSLYHLRHFSVLAGAILNPHDDGLVYLDAVLSNWDLVTVTDLLEIIKMFEAWFAASYFYDVRINVENKTIVDIRATLKAAGL